MTLELHELEAALAAHRAALLRHCYRMVGSHAEAEDALQDALERAWRARESYRGDAPIERWLFAIATNTCLNVLARRRHRALPQLEGEPAAGEPRFGDREPERWITPAPDARLFPDPQEVTESRETVALAFVALLQRVPPRQRAALLLKDVLGWSAEEIAGALELSLASVNSALHRARRAIARDEEAGQEPAPEVLARFVRAWESRDLDGLVALLRDDVVLAMPPYATWFRGAADAAGFFRSPTFAPFWARGVRLLATRANGLPAFAFYRPGDEAGSLVLHALMAARFLGGRAAELTVFVGPALFPGFDLPERLDRTV